MIMKGDVRKKCEAVSCAGSRLQKGEHGGRRQVVGTKAAMPVRDGVGIGVWQGARREMDRDSSS